VELNSILTRDPSTWAASLSCKADVSSYWCIVVRFNETKMHHYDPYETVALYDIFLNLNGSSAYSSL